METKKILIAIDGSEYSTKVVDTAIDYVKMLSAEAVLVYCHKKFPSIRGEPHRSKGIATILQEAENLIAPHLKRLQEAGVQIEERLMEEPAGAMITNVAKIEKCDLIIMGSRGLSNLEGLIIGSVTHKVLNLAGCSVLVVK